MKKVLTVLVVAGMASFLACGPSAEEIAKKEKARQDSIAAVEKEKAKQDSIAAAEAEAAAKEQARQDSIAKAEEAAKKGPKKTNNTKGTDTKVIKGRG